MNNVQGQVTKATMLPIIGILVSGVAAVIAIPELNRGMAPEDRFLTAATVAFLVAGIFGATIVWAQSILAKVSAVKLIDSIRGSAASALAMQWVWLSINAILLFTLLIWFNAALALDGLSSAFFNSSLVSDTMKWSVVPLILLVLLLIGQTLAFVELRAKTVIPERVEPAPTA